MFVLNRLQRYGTTFAILSCLIGGVQAENNGAPAMSDSRGIAERHEAAVREQARSIADTPMLVAPPNPVDDKTPVSDNSFGRGTVRPDCRADNNVTESYRKWQKQWCKDGKLKKGAKPDQTGMPGEAPAGDGKTGNSGGTSAPPPALPGYPNHSCWAVPDQCIQSSGAWGTSELDRKSKRFYTRHKNICSHRVYAKACIEREDNKKPFCGSAGIKPGQTWNWDVSQSNGKYHFLYTGVANGKDDSICPRPSGWKDLGEERSSKTDSPSVSPGPADSKTSEQDIARAWCMRKKNGEFLCNGPLQNGGWGSTLKAALRMAGCSNGTGYEPTIGTGGQSFDCGRERKSYEKIMPLYDPFRNR